MLTEKKLIMTPFGTKIAVLGSLLIATTMIICSSYIVSQQNSFTKAGLLEKQQYISRIGAKAISRIISEIIDSGKYTMNDIFDPEYVPIPNSEPPKYHTRYDRYLDKIILGLQDEFLTDPSVHFAVAIDLNGYIPTHNTPFTSTLSKDNQVESADNQTKRISNDPVALKAAQNKVYGYTQKYNNDKGEESWAISSPIIVKGKQWGAFWINVLPTNRELKTDSFNTTIVTIMIFIFLIVTATVFVMVIILPSKILKNVALLTRQTSALADGDVDNKIEVTSVNEVSELSSAIERLRVSLKLAMDRLNR